MIKIEWQKLDEIYTYATNVPNGVVLRFDDKLVFVPNCHLTKEPIEKNVRNQGFDIYGLVNTKLVLNL